MAKKGVEGKINLKNLRKKKENKNRDLNIELFNPLKEAARRLEEEKKKKNKNLKIVINCNTKLKKNQKKINLITDPNMKSEYTQTEEIFFKMHWSYFSGQYKIMSSNILGNLLDKNNFDISSNWFGQFKNNTLYRKQVNLNNLRTLNKFNSMNPAGRAKSFNNKIIINNNNNIKKYSDNNLNKVNINIMNNRNDNEQKNNLENHYDLSEENRNKIMQNKNKLLNYNLEKNSKNHLINSNVFKAPTPFVNSLIKNNIHDNKLIASNIINKNTNNNFFSTKYNNKFNNKIYTDNIKSKMAKSSTSFYKQ